MMFRKQGAVVPVLFLAISAVIAAGCGSGPGSGGLERKSSVSLELKWPANYSFDSSTSQLNFTSSPKMSAAPAYVTGCRVTISGADMTPITLDVPLSTGQVGGTVTPGERRFDVAVDTNIGLSFTGSATAMLVPGNNSGISIQLAVNALPAVILSVSNSSPKLGEAVTVTASVTDLDATDTHTFAWDGGGGSISGSGPSVTWVSSQAGSYTVSVTVNDGMGGVVTQSVGINIMNNPPVMKSVKVDKAVGTKTGVVIYLSCSATDADGDPISYSWSDGLGWSANGQSVSYTVTDFTIKSRSVTCVASDGMPGGTAKWSLTLGSSSVSSLLTDTSLASCVASRFLGTTSAAQISGELDCSNKNIRSVAGLGNFTGLTKLNLRTNSIVNVAPLAALTNLTYLDLFTNSIGGQGVGNVSSLLALKSAQIYLTSNISMSCAELNTLICGSGNTVAGNGCSPASTGLGTNVEIAGNGIGNWDTPMGGQTAGQNCTNP